MPKKNQAPSTIDSENQASMNYPDELEHAAIRAIQDMETNRLLTYVQLLRSNFTQQQLHTPLLQYFDQHLSNLSISGNAEEEQLDVHWKTNLPSELHESLFRTASLAYPDTYPLSNLHFSTKTVNLNSKISSQLQYEHSVIDVPSLIQTTGFQDGLQTPGVTNHRMSVGVTPKALRLPKKGEMLLSVRGSPLGVFQEKEDNMGIIDETEEC